LLVLGVKVALKKWDTWRSRAPHDFPSLLPRHLNEPHTTEGGRLDLGGQVFGLRTSWESGAGWRSRFYRWDPKMVDLFEKAPIRGAADGRFPGIPVIFFVLAKEMEGK